MPGKLFPLGGPVPEKDVVDREDFIVSLQASKKMNPNETQKAIDHLTSKAIIQKAGGAREIYLCRIDVPGIYFALCHGRQLVAAV